MFSRESITLVEERKYDRNIIAFDGVGLALLPNSQGRLLCSTILPMQKLKITVSAISKVGWGTIHSYWQSFSLGIIT